MNRFSSNTPANSRLHESNLELFRARLIPKLFIALICAVQFIPRLIITFSYVAHNKPVDKYIIISLPFIAMITLIISTEYFLFKKKGPGIIRYSSFIDFTLLLLFMGDWILITIASAVQVLPTDPPSFKTTALYGFTNFSWRTLLVTLIVQNWKLKIIAPVAAILVAAGFTIHYMPIYIVYILTIIQVFNVIIIIYSEDKLKWSMIWMNLQQEKWMQVNNFILNNIPENIMILDPTGTIKFISDYCKSFMEDHHLSIEVQDSFNKIKDLQQQQCDSGRPSSNLRVARLQTDSRLLSEHRAGAETLQDLIVNFKSIITNKDLQERQFLIYNRKLKTEEENIPDKAIEIKISFVHHFKSEYIILILRDTTQRDLLVTLQETNKYKDQLLASVSHELRAPLNGNINLVEAAVHSQQIPENIKESLLIPALRSSKFLLHIINDILDMSQIKEKKLRLALQPGDIKETLKSTAQLIELQAKKKRIQLIIELDSHLSDKFCTDHMRLSQIVLNLLSNAIKFTSEGAIKLIAARINGTNFVNIRVEDSGIGISPENQEKLFSNYTQIEFEGRQKMNPTGVGLGLNIASNLAGLLGPQGLQGIKVESIPSQGSVFSFTIEDKSLIQGEEDREISLEVADEVPRTMRRIISLRLNEVNLSTSLPPSTGRALELEALITTCSCPKVLIVDDNPFNTMAFETILRSLEIKCDSVYSGESAIQKLLDHQTKLCGWKECKLYSVVFMDHEMPEMSGAEAVREIRRLQQENRIPLDVKIIGCTAHKSKEEVEKFLRAGLDQCIHKPISTVMIKDVLKGFY